MRKLFYVIITILCIIILFLILPQNKYLRKALVYQTVNINDYLIFENRPVKAGEVQTWKLAANYNKKIIPEKYSDILNDLKTVAFVVIKDNEVVHESYYKGYNRTSLSNSFSVSKSIISLLIGCAIDEGAIKSLDQSVADFIPEFNTPENSKLTLKELLTMSSGLNWDEAYASPFSTTTKAYYGDDLYSLVTQLKVTEKPGVQFKYLSCNTQLLSLILEKATHKHAAEYASEKLWIPLGAGSDAEWCLDKKDGIEKAYCCFNSNALDFARFGQLILNKGKWNGQQVISEKYIEESTCTASWLKDEWGKNSLDYYGYHWWISSYEGKRVIYARGILGQYIIVVPDYNMVIVRLGEKRCSLRTANKPSDFYIWLNLGKYIAN